MKHIILFLTLLLLLAACTKDERCNQSELEQLLAQQRSSLPSAIQILDMLEQPTDGYIWLKSFSGPADTRPATQCSGFVNGPWDTNLIGSTLQFGSITTTMPNTANDVHFSNFIDAGYQHENLYGTTQNVRITLPGGGEQALLNSDFYIPKHITVTNYTFQLHQKPDYQTGSTIEWVADQVNTLGIGIAVVYESQDPENRAYTNSKSVANLIHTEDDGSYTFSASDFADIPAGAHINIVIGRGNYQIAPLGTGGKKAGIYSYSAKSIPSRYTN